MPSDIDLTQIIFRKIPPAWHPYIKLARLDRPIGIWLLLFPCLWGIIMGNGGITNISLETIKIIVLFVVGAILMRAAGCIVNDLWDRQLDASVDRTKTRPLASGEISISHALRFFAALLALSFLILIMLPRITVILGILSFLLVGTYPYMKRLIWMPQLFLGLTFNWGALMGWSAVTGRLEGASFLLYIAGIFWTLGYDTIYAHQDKEDDIRIGIKSTARLFGENSRIFVAGFYALSVLFLMISKYAVSPNLLTPVLAALPACQAIWQIKTWDMNNPESCLRIFKSNQYYGWLALLMLAI